TGPVKGFATTLLIGIATSLFSAIFITRLFIDSRNRKNKPLVFSTATTKNWFANVHISFTGKRKIVYIISGLAVDISIFSIFTRGFDQGVDFVGGRSYNIRFEKEVNAPEIEDVLTDIFGSVEGKTFGADNQLKITTKYKIDEDSDAVEKEIVTKIYNALLPQFPEGFTLEDFKSSDAVSNLGIMSSVKVGPSIADDIKAASFWAVIASIIGIFLYILFRFKGWQFSLGAVVALIHDTIILLGIFSLFYSIMPFSLEIDQSFIAGILTVVGYSINDTVITFDRIREFFKVHPKWGLRKNVNESISSTLGRTVITATTT